jgi:hypothetical protein
MHLHLAVRRLLAVTASTALLTTGGAAGGLLGSASAAPGDPAVASATPAADNNSGSTATAVTINGSGFVPSSDTVKFVPNQGPTTFSTPLPTDVGPISATVVSNGSTSTPTALKVTVPLALAAPGSYDITVVQGPTGGTVICTACFTVTSNGVPDVSSIAPGASTGGTSRGGRALDIAGSFFAKGATVSFLQNGTSTPDPGLAFTPGDPNNSTSSSTGGYASSGLIRGNYSLPASTTFTPGKHAVLVTNTDGGKGATGEFWQPLFDASGVSPTSTGAGSQNRVVTVTGQGIRAGSSLSIQNLASFPNPSDVSVGTASVNAAGTSISAPVTFASTATTNTLRSMSVNGPDGGTYGVANAFKVTAAPVISSLSTNALGQGAVTEVGISGSDFAAGGSAGLPTFTFSGTGVSAVTKRVDVSTNNPPMGTPATTVTTAIVTVTVARDATLSGRTVTVTNPDAGSSTLGQGTNMAYPLTINPGPVVSSVVPGSSPRGTTKTIVIKGLNLDSTGGVDVVFSLPPASGAARTPDTTLSVGTVTVTKGTSPAPDTASFPVTISSTAPFGLRDVSLRNKGDSGSYLCAGCFGVDSLTVSPAAGSNTGAKSLTFSVAGIPSGSTVQIVRSGDPAYQPHLTGANPVVVADNGSLTALFDLTNAAPGPYNAIVTQGNTVLTCSGCFTVTGSSPSLTSVTPNTGGQGAVNRAITLVGTGFSRGEQVAIAGTSVHDVTFVSPTQLTALVDIPSNLATGTIDVVVTNADGVGTNTLAKGFTVNAAPAVSSVTPTSYGQGAKLQNITLVGPGFAGDSTGAPASTVSFGPGVTVTKVVVTQGMVVPVVTPNPDDTLVATVTIDQTAPATLRDVVVTNPDGGAGTLVKGFTVNIGPKVLSVSPTALAPGSSGKTLTITGSGFSTTSGKTAVPTIAGVTLTSPVVSADGTTITAMAAVAASQAKGTPDVLVNNPTDQGNGTLPAGFAIATAPSAPTNVVVQAGNSQVVVTWAAPSDNGGAPITSYVVSTVGPDGKPVGNVVTVDGKTTTATITGLTSGTVYKVSVVARNAAGDSPAATATSTANGVPTAPTATATAGDTTVTVGYSGATSAGSPITGYTIYITNGTTTTTQSAAAGSASALVTGLTNGTTYSFAVAAKNATGDGAKSASVTATPRLATRLTSVSAPAGTTPSGVGVTYSGRLTRTSSGAAIGGATIQLSLRPDVGSGGQSLTLSTDGNGLWHYTGAPVYSTVVRVAYAGTAQNLSAAAAAYRHFVSTRLAITSPRSGSRTSARTPLVVTSSTSPNKAGASMTLFRYLNGRLVAVARTSVARNGVATFSARLGKGRYSLVVFIGGTHGNTGAYSRGISVTRG